MSFEPPTTPTDHVNEHVPPLASKRSRINLSLMVPSIVCGAMEVGAMVKLKTPLLRNDRLAVVMLCNALHSTKEANMVDQLVLFTPPVVTHETLRWLAFSQAAVFSTMPKGGAGLPHTFPHASVVPGGAISIFLVVYPVRA